MKTITEMKLGQELLVQILSGRKVTIEGPETNYVFMLEDDVNLEALEKAVHDARVKKAGYADC